MKTDIERMYDYYVKGRRSCYCFTSKMVSSRLAKAYITYCYEKGYRDLKSCPDIESVINELKYLT